MLKKRFPLRVSDLFKQFTREKQTHFDIYPDKNQKPLIFTCAKRFSGQQIPNHDFNVSQHLDCGGTVSHEDHYGYEMLLLLLLLLHLITHSTKCYTNSKVRALSEKTNSGLTVRSLNSTGNSFQQLGPATAKALEPQSVLWLGTTRSPRTADLKADRPETAEPLVQKATR